MQCCLRHTEGSSSAQPAALLLPGSRARALSGHTSTATTEVAALTFFVLTKIWMKFLASSLPKSHNQASSNGEERGVLQ